METMETEKRAYEVGFMARDEKGIHEVVDRLKAHGAEITLEGPVELSALAYRIEKQTQAHFGYLHFMLDPAEVAPLSGELERAAGVIRFLIVTPPFVKPKPRPMMQDRPRSAPRPQGPEKREAPGPLSNQALEKKIEEILQEA